MYIKIWDLPIADFVSCKLNGSLIPEFDLPLGIVCWVVLPSIVSHSCKKNNKS